MSLANYTDLQNRLSDWLSHTLFTGNYGDLVTLFEAAANRRLRVRQMEATMSLVPEGGNDSYTKVLLHLDGASGSTTVSENNAGGSSSHAWTASNSAQISTAASKFGGASLRLNAGTADYVSTPGSPDFVLGGNDFTIDAWFNITDGDGTDMIIAGQADSGFTTASRGFYIQRSHSNNNVLQVQCGDGGAAGTTINGVTQLTSTINPGWHHVAFVRNGSVFSIYLDGTLEASSSHSGAVQSSTNNLSLGRPGESSGQYWSGYIDEFRISVGIARWTANFTPPLGPYSAPGAQMLPSDYLAWRRVTWTGQTRRELGFVHPSYFQAAYPSQPADIPAIFTIEGSTLKVMPLDPTALEFDYYQLIPALAANSTNWLMTAHPDLYLFGSLCEAEMFGVNDERAPIWKARRDEVFEEIIRLNNQTRAPSYIRVFGPTP